jgi:hypothetical protein
LVNALADVGSGAAFAEEDDELPHAASPIIATDSPVARTANCRR